jgi:hypothetical protein
MSEIKFACPVCGQHITCDSAKSGAQVDCPTCFQKLIVPHAPQGDAAKLILNASLAASRRFHPDDTKAQAAAGARAAGRRRPVAAAGLIVLACAAGALLAFRGKIFKPPPAGDGAAPASQPRTKDAHWTLNLAAVAIPDAPVAGRINGKDFTPQRVVLRGGTLDLRQGADAPPELGLAIALFARRGEDLARQSITIAATRSNAPKAILRFKNDQGQFVAQPFPGGYALRLEFGSLTNNVLPGKIYFCAPDAAGSWVAGSFAAEIRKPPPAKSRPARPPARKR